ncbi:MAG: hypothetical protein IJ017_00795 [Oscillospiraceae bacterium]|nr:hypothetical protein [Oscillospiraceae bacterium]
MKKLTAVLLALIFIITAFGCSQSDTITCYASPDEPEISETGTIDDKTEPEMTDIPDNAPPDAVLPSAVVAEAENFTVTLPDVAAENCDFTISGDSIMFTMKDGGDFVCQFVCCSASDYTDEFWTYKVSENGSDIVYISFPTCGTLNNEAIRDTLEDVSDALKTATVEFK